MPKLPRLETHNIAFLKRKKRDIDKARDMLRRLPLNERVRNALFTAGLPRMLADNAPDRKTAEALLDDYWNVVQAVMEDNFDRRHVEITVEALTKGTQPLDEENEE